VGKGSEKRRREDSGLQSEKGQVGKNLTGRKSWNLNSTDEAKDETGDGNVTLNCYEKIFGHVPRFRKVECRCQASSEADPEQKNMRRMRPRKSGGGLEMVDFARNVNRERPPAPIRKKKSAAEKAIRRLKRDASQGETLGRLQIGK